MGYGFWDKNWAVCIRRADVRGYSDRFVTDAAGVPILTTFMSTSTLFGIPLGHPPTLHPSALSSIPSGEYDRLAPYRRTAIHILAEHELELPGWDVLTLIVESALASRDLYFVASINRPCQMKLDEHFAAFVLSCAVQAMESEVV